MNSDIIKNVIVDQKKDLVEKINRETIVQRDGITKCKKYISHPNLLLISGPRRAGKSFFSHLLFSKANYVFLNFDDERLIELKTEHLNLVLQCFYELQPHFDSIVFDEIQNIKGWELFINRLREKYKVIITGSNANLLSKELSTHLTGRYVDFELYPLSFAEFIDFNSMQLTEASIYSTKAKSEIYALFDQYLNYGGIFDYYKFGKEFLRNLFSSIITKDVVVRYKIKYHIALEELALLLVNNFASKISINRLTNHLKLKDFHTTQNYIKYLENTFLIFNISKFSYKLKSQLSSFKKVYVIDNGIINALTFSFSQNRGRYLENIIAIELKRRGFLEDFEIYYWDNYYVECDFIIKKNLKIVAAYQVCWELNMNNKKREVDGLVKALKEFDLKEGVILTANTEDIIEEAGYTIKITPVWRFLIEGKMGV